MDELQTSRFLIAGKVQGVWFRASTRNEALRLNLRGYASNRADGRVEVLAIGEADAIALLFNWLRHGPPLADVESVERLEVGSCISEPMDADSFQIR